MAMKTGMPFLELLEQKVIGPLGLTDTSARLVSGQKDRFVQPKNTKGKDVLPWTFQALAGAGCLRSTARDLTHFSAAVLDALASPTTTLDRAICESVKPLLGLGCGGKMEPEAQCLGWLSLSLGGSAPRMLHHNGATAGSTCTLYICPDREAAVGILSNNCIGGNVWASTKLNWTNPRRQALNHFAK